MQIRTVCHLISALVFSVASNAQASVMSFGTGGTVSGSGYTQNGLSIAPSASPFVVRDFQGATIGAPGERELMVNLSPGGVGGTGPIKFQLRSGGLFDLLSLDIEQPGGGYSTWSVFGSLSVTASNGQSQSLAANQFGTNTFTAFDDIYWFVLSTPEIGQVFVDNINFSPAVNSVPEPTSLSLAALGLTALGLRRRRH